jgi:hypothetical protein
VLTTGGGMFATAGAGLFTAVANFTAANTFT